MSILGQSVVIVLFGFAALHGTPTTTQTVNDKPASFEVVSIRPANPEAQGGFAITTDGYRSTETLRATIVRAYLPFDLRNDEKFLSVPSWTNTERYDINAKVAMAELPAWKSQNTIQKSLLEKMLQAALVERCRLVMHYVPTELMIYALTAVPQGAKLTQTQSGNEHPPGMKLSSEGNATRDKEAIHFYAATMEELATYISLFFNPGLPLRDQTGLKEKYDFVLPIPEKASPLEGVETGPPQYLLAVPLEGLGLKIGRSKLVVNSVVVDKIERPTAN